MSEQIINEIVIDENEFYAVGKGFSRGPGVVTSIEMIMKSGMHCDIPYLRVYKNEFCIAEFCQHNITGIYFKEPAQ